MKIIRDLFLSRRTSEPCHVGRAALYTAVIALGTFSADRSFTHPSIQVAPDLHAWMSLDLAANAAFCGTTGYRSAVFSPSGFLVAHPDQMAKSIVAIIESERPSLVDYCRSLTVPFVNSENSLMLAMTGALKVAPKLSVAGLGRALTWLRLAFWCAVAFVLAWSGASVALTAWAFVAGVAVLRSTAFELSEYSFLMVLPALMACLYAAAVRVNLVSAAARVVFALAAGACTALATNTRTSYLPIYTLFFLMTLFAQPISRQTAAVALSFVVGFGIVDRIAIRAWLTPHEPVPGGFSHPIVHPIVLGVATPENDFARGLGIAWSDPTGLELAHRVDPQAEYLGRGYDRALWIYYMRLWRQYPREMCRLYAFKLARAGRGLFMGIRRVRIVPGLRPDRAQRLDDASNGFVLLAVTLAVAGLSLFRAVRHQSALAWAIGLFSVAAAAILLESAIIMPTFTAMYHSYLLFYFLLLPALVVQAALDALWAVRTA